MMTVSSRTCVFAKFLATYLILFGAAAMNAGSAQDAAPVAHQSDAEANPIDTRITTQPPSHSKHGVRARAVKKSAIARSSGNSNTRRQVATHAAAVGVVRNAIGQPVQHTLANVKPVDVKASEPTGANGTAKNSSAAGNSGIETVGAADSHRQALVPLRAGGVTQHAPQTNTAMNHSIINGRDMVRPGMIAGAIGGPAKSHSGGISGTDFRSKHSATQ
jgi:hypothetical protein